ncbi:hypothetical protein CCP4SC76_1550003 [Gammaproteobacteria bacterium]
MFHLDIAAYQAALDLGADLYDDDHDSILGLFRKNNLLFVEWIRHF